jgi:DNA-binding response OmpR family regulator
MKGNILVVDDSPTVGRVVTWMLTEQGYEVRKAEDGIRALSALHTFHADLILLDVKLPYFDGLKLCQMLRRGIEYGSTPIVMISGKTSPEDIERALAAGADGYLCKPFSDIELVHTVEKVLAQRIQRLAS